MLFRLPIHQKKASVDRMRQKCYNIGEENRFIIKSLFEKKNGRNRYGSEPGETE